MGGRTSSQLIGSYSKYANAGKGRQRERERNRERERVREGEKEREGEREGGGETSSLPLLSWKIR